MYLADSDSDLNGLLVTRRIVNTSPGGQGTISVWNSLPSSVVLSKTIEEFKASI